MKMPSLASWNHSGTWCRCSDSRDGAKLGGAGGCCALATAPRARQPAAARMRGRDQRETKEGDMVARSYNFNANDNDTSHIVPEEPRERTSRFNLASPPAGGVCEGVCGGHALPFANHDPQVRRRTRSLDVMSTAIPLAMSPASILIRGSNGGYAWLYLVGVD